MDENIKKPKKQICAIVTILAAIAFTVYIALDTFVISYAYTPVSTTSSSYSSSSGSSSGSISSSSGSSGSSSSNSSISTGEVVSTDTTYEDDNIKITVTTYRENDTNIYVADVQVSSAEYLQTALAQATYGKNITDTTSNMADEVNAILAINGDYYGTQETGYVIRNGVLYRDTADSDQEDLVIYEDGSFEIINEDDVTAETLMENGAYNVLSFGPALIVDGEISVTENDEVAKAMASNPRTAIGIIDDLHYVFVVADGRTDESEGLSLYQLAQFLETLDVTCAYNLDGGGSSTMVFNGEVVNTPTSTRSGSERKVSDIVYIGY
ncbi:MAG: phosphodiester glycosidase family protein [Lachnospiraceae bacterium]|nr:phosphodiester glycosidase family protein [Lachnospiraceae bacterium]